MMQVSKHGICGDHPPHCPPTISNSLTHSCQPCKSTQLLTITFTKMCFVSFSDGCALFRVTPALWLFNQPTLTEATCRSDSGYLMKKVETYYFNEDKWTAASRSCFMAFTSPLPVLYQNNGKLHLHSHRFEMSCKRNHWLFANVPIELLKINITLYIFQ